MPAENHIFNSSHQKGKGQFQILKIFDLFNLESTQVFYGQKVNFWHEKMEKVELVFYWWKNGQIQDRELGSTNRRVASSCHVDFPIANCFFTSKHFSQDLQVPQLHSQKKRKLCLAKNKFGEDSFQYLLAPHLLQCLLEILPTIDDLACLAIKKQSNSGSTNQCIWRNLHQEL